MLTSTLVVTAMLLAAVSQPSTAAESAPELWEAWYSVSARVRTMRVDADLEAGGRLAMTGLADPSGGLTLSLSEVLEHPWKLYWVDPIGPVGEEVKVASVVTLREASWNALAAAEAESEISAAERHRRWFETAERPRKLDGSFAFVVVGDPRKGFGFEVAPSGRVARIANRMTNRWLFGPFGQFVGKPAAETPAGRQAEPEPVGYWFWNQGEEEPHGYEPHTYHAFAAALALLSRDLPAASTPAASTEETVTWLRLESMVIQVLSILAPRIDASSLPADLPVQTLMGVSRESLATGGSRLTLRSAAAPSHPHVERETVFSSEGRPVRDRIRVRIGAIGGGNLEVEAGYAPLNPQQESR